MRPRKMNTLRLVRQDKELERALYMKQDPNIKDRNKVDNNQTDKVVYAKKDKPEKEAKSTSISLEYNMNFKDILNGSFVVDTWKKDSFK